MLSLFGFGKKSRRSQKSSVKQASFKKLTARHLAVENLERRELLSITWDGGGGDYKWSTAANWVGDVVPGANADLVFSGTTRTATINDLSTTFRSITFSASGFTIDGSQDIHLTTGITATYGATISSGVSLGGTATVNIASGQTLLISGVISGTSNYGLTKTGSGTLSLAGNNTYPGTTTISTGTLQTTGSGTLPSGNDVTLANSSGVTLNISNANQVIDVLSGGGSMGGAVVLGSTTLSVNSGTYSGGISGTGGSLTKAGSGTLNLNGSNTYTGDTTIEAGGTLIVTVGSAGTALPSGNVVNDGTLTFNVGSTSSYPYSHAISGDGDFVKSGTGTLILSQANTYGGSTTINGGMLQLNVDHALFEGDANHEATSVYFGTSGTLALNGHAQTIAGLFYSGGSGMSMLDGELDSPNDQLDLFVDDMSALGGGGGGSSVSVTLGSGTLYVGSGTFAGVISGTGSVHKVSDGQLTLSGENTYSGGTSISNGTLQIGNGSTTGSITGNVSLASGTSVLAFNRSNTLTFSNVISGSGNIVQNGTGVLTLSGTNIFTGTTTISTSTGTLALSNPNALQNSTLNYNSGGGTLSLGSLNPSSAILGGLDGSKNLVLPAGFTLAVGNNNSDTSYSGVLSSAGEFAITKTGTGTLTLTNQILGDRITVVQGNVNITGTGTTLTLGSFDTESVGAPVEIYATWAPGQNNNNSATYEIFDGTTSLGTVMVDQTATPNDFILNGQYYRDLGVWISTSSAHSLTVKLASATATESAAPVYFQIAAPNNPRYSLPSGGDGVVKIGTNSADGSLQALFTPFGLVYNSAQVNPHPIISVDAKLQPINNAHAMSGVEAYITFNNGTPSSHVYYNAASTADFYRFAFQVDASGLNTGRYDWHITVIQHYSGADDITLDYYGTKDIINRSTSPYGDGWWLADLDQLVPQTGGIAWVTGDGNFIFFEGNDTSGYTPETGDLTFSTLSGTSLTGYTLTEKDGTQLVFDTSNRLHYVIDRNGNQTTYTYTDGKLTLKELADHNSFTYSYPSGYLVSIGDPAGESTTFGYTGTNLTSITQPDPDDTVASDIPVFEFGYDSGSRMTSFTDAEDNQTTFDYGVADGTHRTKITYADSTYQTLTYAQLPALVLTTTGPGGSDPKATLVSSLSVAGSVLDQLGHSSTFKVDRFGDIASSTNPLSETTAYVYDQNGLAVKMIEPDPDTIGSGQPAPVWHYQYDAKGNLTKLTRPDGTYERWVYDLTYSEPTDFYEGTAQSVETLKTLYYYDSLGNLTKLQQVVGTADAVAIGRTGDDAITTYTYTTLSSDPADPVAGLVDTETDPLGYVTKYEYDDVHGGKNSSLPTDVYTVYSVDGYGTHFASHANYVYSESGNMTQENECVDNGDGSISTRTTNYEYDDLGRMTKMTPAAGPYTRYHYDTMSHVTSTVEYVAANDQRTTSYVYNNMNRLESVTLPDPDGATEPLQAPEYNYTYYDNGQLYTQSELNPSGNDVLTTYTYYENGLLHTTSVPNPSGGTITTTYEYDHLGRVTEVTDALNNVATFAYANYGLTVTETDPDPDGPSNPLTSPVTVTNYNWQGLVTSATDANNHTTSYEYDDLYRLHQITQPSVTVSNPSGSGTISDSPTTVYTYYKDGSLLSVTDPMDRVTEYQYDYVEIATGSLAKNLQMTQIQPDPSGTGAIARDGNGNPTSANVFTVSEYNAAGQLLSVTDPMQNITSYNYDNLGRVTYVFQPVPSSGAAGGPTTSYAYNSTTGDLYSVSDPSSSGSTTYYQYDALHRLTQTTESYSANGQTHNDATCTAYDNAGNVKEVTDPMSNHTTYTYDALHRLTQQMLPNPTNGTAGSALTTDYTYDALGHVLTTTDGNGNTTTNAYDNLGRLHSVTQPRPSDGLANAGPVTTYGYDSVGNRTSLTDAKNYATSWHYNAVNWVDQQTDPNNQNSYYLYNSDGELTQLTDRNSRVTSYDYDALGRKTEERWQDYSGGSVTRTFSYVYDKDSRLEDASDAIGGTTLSANHYEYDQMGRATTIEATIPGLAPEVSLVQNFDDNSNRTDVTAYIDSIHDFSNSYQYAANRMVEVHQYDNAVAEKYVNIDYNNNGQLFTISRSINSVSVANSTYTYDRATRLTGLSYALPAGSDAAPSYGWTYDNGNRITQFTSAKDATLDYSYDHVNQLTSDDTQTYAYDATGNRTGGTYASTTGNRMTYDAQGNHYEYDNEGNRTRVTASGGQTKTEYVYDNRNRLTEVKNFSLVGGNWVQGKTVDYTYDVFDRLVEKTVDNTHDGITDSQDAYVYDGQNVVLQFHKDGSGAMTGSHLSRRFLNGPAVDQVFAEEVVSGVHAGETLWLLADNQGTIRDVAVSEFDDQQDYRDETHIKDHLVYDGYGNFTQSEDDYEPTFTYTGRPYDADAKLYNYRVRGYDPKTGRMTSEDPTGFSAGDVNLTRYCFNSPTNFTDPSGMVASGGGGWAGNVGNANYGYTRINGGGIDLGSSFLADPIPTSDPLFPLLPQQEPPKFSDLPPSSLDGPSILNQSNDLKNPWPHIRMDEIPAPGDIHWGPCQGKPINLGPGPSSGALLFDAVGGAAAGKVLKFVGKGLVFVGKKVVAKVVGKVAAETGEQVVKETGKQLIVKAEGQVVTKARGKVAPSNLGAKRGPKTDPNSPHNATIRTQGDLLEAGGNTVTAGGGKLPERLVPTPGGLKEGRRPDILFETPNGQIRGRNVGKTDAAGNPVKRELDALKDLNGPGGIPTDFVPL